MALVLQALDRQAAFAAEPEFEALLKASHRAANQVLVRPTAAAHTERGSGGQQTTGHPAYKRQWLWPTGLRLKWACALAVVLLGAGGLGYCYLWRPTSPVERSLASLRATWSDSRPLEARVTGGFSYLPYSTTRGQNGTGTVNQNLLLAAKAELAREVGTKPTVEAHHALGRLHLLEGDFDKARAELEAALSQAPENPALHVDLAALYYERGLLEQSPLLLTQAAEYCTTATRLAPQLPEAWFNLALCQEQRLLLAESRAAWEKYLELDRSSKWADEARAHLEKLRERTSRVGSPADSSALPDKLLAAARAEDETPLRALLTEHFTEAVGLACGRWLDEYLKARDGPERAAAEPLQRLLQRIARFAAEEKNDLYLTDLLHFLTQADSVTIKKVQETRSQLRQAEQQHNQGDYDGALALYEKAHEAAEQNGDVCHSETARCGLARIFSPHLETPARRALRERLVAETARRQHRQLQARALLALANSYDLAQLISKTLLVSTQAYEIADRLSDFDTAINSLRYVGGAYSRLGNSEAAISKNFAALELLFKGRVTPLRACQFYSQLAEAFARGAQPAQALAYQLEAWQYCDSNIPAIFSATARGRTGLYYAQTGRHEEAVRLINDAVARAEKYSDAAVRDLLLTDLYLSLGYLHLQQAQYDGATQAFLNAQGVVASAKHPRYLSAIHEGLAICYREKGQIEAAEIELQKSLHLAERARGNINESRGRSAFLSARLSVYRAMIDFQYSAKGLFDSAYYYAELSRSRELLDALSENAEFRCQPSSTALECPGSVKPLKLQQVQRALPREAQLLEYAVTERGLLIWVVTAEQAVPTKVAITPAQLQQTVAAYLAELYAHRDLAATNRQAAALYQWLIAPVASLLDKKRTLVLIPDGVLCALPFAALVDPATGRYLLADYTLITSPSASVLVRTLNLGRAKRKARYDALLVLSNPKLDYQLYRTLRSLPHSEREAEQMKALYPSGLHLSRQAANKQALLAHIDDYDLVHLATHSVINEQNPLLSTIVLAAPEPTAAAPAEINAAYSAGGLSAHEIFGLRLKRTRLVILSSCRSGLMMQTGHNNGIGSLAHAFFSAQVPTVIGSLWEVDDESTAELMTAFHEFHRVGRQSFSQALRQAQLEILRRADGRWQHPFYWAAFTLTGDGFTA